MVHVGQMAYLGASVQSALPLIFQWQRNGTNLTSATNSFLSWSPVQSADAGTYSLIASSSAGSVTSAPAVLTVLLTPNIYWPVSTITVSVGDSYGLGTSFIYGAPPFSFEWRKGTPTNSVLLGTNQTHQLSNIQASDVGTYFLVVSNAYGSFTSYPANLVLWPPPPITPPQITVQPVGGLFLPGAKITNFVVIANPQSCSYQWQRNGANLLEATSSNYVISFLFSALAGDYRVIVSNSAGSVTSSVAQIEMLTTPRISAHPASQTLVRGGVLSLSVAAIGGSPPSYAWRRNGVLLPEQTNSTLSVTNVQRGDAGTYQATVANLYGSTISSNATVTVLTPPLITGISSDLTVPATTGAMLFVSADGLQPMNVQLWKDGAPYTGTNFLLDFIQIGGDTSLSRRLNLVNAQPGDAGTYQFVITNAHGAITSAPVLIAVGSAPVPVAILQQPQDAVVDVGGSVTFSVVASGSAPLDYAWQRHVPPSTNGPPVIIFPVFPNYTASATFTLTNAQLTDAGAYEVLVRNPAGSVPSRVFNLGVRQPLVVSRSPTNQVVNRGASLTLEVVAQGTFPVTYQWLKDGTNLPGATNSQLRFVPSFQPRDAGSYRLLVADADGSQTSLPPAHLFLNPLPGMPGEVDESFRAAGPGGFIHAVLPESDGGVVVAGNFGFPASGGGGGGVTIGVGGSGGTVAVTPAELVTDKDSAAHRAPGVKAAALQPVNLVTNPVGIARLRVDGSLDTSFPALAGGMGGSIYALARQADGRILVGGYFSTMNGANIANLARLNADGSLDASFQPQPNASVRAIIVQPDQRILIGGVFTSVAGAGRAFFARLQPDGSLDTGFAAGGGPDNLVVGLGTLADGRLMLAGHFRNYAGTPRSLLARVNTDGSLDGSFDPGSGPAIPVSNRDLAVLPDGRCYLGGSMHGYRGRASAVTRILVNGDLDASFPAIEPLFLPFTARSDGKVIVSGGFSQLTIGSASPRETYQRSCIARFNADGTPDIAFDAGEFTGTSFSGLWTLPSGDVLGSVSGTNPAGFASPLIRLRGHDAAPTSPQIWDQPAAVAVLNGQFVSFRVLATGSRPLNYRWLQNGSNLPTSLFPPHFASLLSTMPALEFLAHDRNMSGHYSVIVSNAGGAAVSTAAALRVLVPQRVEPPIVLPTGGFRLRFGDYFRPFGTSAEPPLPPRFEVYASTNLLSTNWVLLTNALVSSNGEFTLDDTGATNHTRRFYRVLER